MVDVFHKTEDQTVILTSLICLILHQIKENDIFHSFFLPENASFQESLEKVSFDISDQNQQSYF